MGLLPTHEKESKLEKETREKIARLEELTNEIESETAFAAEAEAQIIGYMIENKISELTIGDTVIVLELEEQFDFDKMKKDGVYDEFVKRK